MRTNLVVPFAEKDKAKKLGARWDAGRKVWYVQGVENLEAFAAWLPGHPQKSPAGTETPSPAARSATPKQPGQPAVKKSAGVSTGPKDLPLSCDCLPWLGCEKCQPVLAAMGWGAKAHSGGMAA